jgi:hypothetical protein
MRHSKSRQSYWLTMLCLLTGPAAAVDWLYLTMPGDTLLSISERYLDNPNRWNTLRQLNNVANPRMLPANTRLRIPVNLLKTNPAPARVNHVEGNVRIRPEGGVYRPLKNGDLLAGGETVLTGPRSHASYVLADGSKVNQADSTRLVFGKLTSYGATGMVSTELNLEAGRIEADASKQTFPGAGFKVTTPVAVAGLRGTSFRLNMAEDGKTLRNEVLEGAVGVGAQNQEALVGAGFGTLAEAGKAPEAPRPLLAAPSADKLPKRIVDAPARFAWLADGKAQAWRAQIARNNDFSDVIFDNLLWQPVATWRDLPADGHYVLRLRAIDGAGLEGLNLDHPFELDVRPLPPSAQSPDEGRRLLSKRVDLTWEPVTGANGYVLQVAHDRNFNQERMEHRIAQGQRLELDLNQGTHYWRLASLDEQGAAHAWSKTRSFRVQPPPETPSEVRARMRDGALHISWQGQAPEYRIEIASDEAFKQIVGRHRSVTAEARITRPQPGRYWLRVVPYDAEGIQGGASTHIPIQVSGFF